MGNIVLSGINISDTGALSIYKQIILELIRLRYSEKNNITAFVHRKELFKEFEQDINFIELPKSKKHWINRLYYEYIYFKKYSKNKDIDIWFSVHEITPNVKAKRRYVYCHNPTPFYNAKIKEGIQFYLRSKLFKYVYRINIHKNKSVIVQQEWIRKEFIQLFKLNNIIVANPNQSTSKFKAMDNSCDNKKYKFIYASFPRRYKNFETICEASKILNEKNIKNFEAILTIDGSENKYSKKIVEKYKDINQIKFIGLQKQEKLFDLYNESNCMIFPSKLETWGLPITEYKETDKPIILADLPYAHETLGNYKKASFFNPTNSKKLSEIMLKEINGKNDYAETKAEVVKEPYAQNWEQLLKMIID